MSSNRAPKSGFAAEAQRKVKEQQQHERERKQILPKINAWMCVYVCVCACIAFIWAYLSWAELSFFAP